MDCQNLKDAILTNCNECFLYYISDSDLINKKLDYATYPIILVCIHDRTYMLDSLLATPNINVNVIFQGFTALSKACFKNINMVKKLVNNGALVNPPVATSPLSIACFHGYVDIVAFLISKEAIIDDKALFAACRGLNIEVIELLINNGANVDAVHNGRNLLRFMVGQLTIGYKVEQIMLVIETLIKHGASTANMNSPWLNKLVEKHQLPMKITF